LNLRHEVNKEVEKERDKHAKTGRPSNAQIQVFVFFNSEKKEMRELWKFMVSDFENVRKKKNIHSCYVYFCLFFFFFSFFFFLE